MPEGEVTHGIDESSHGGQPKQNGRQDTFISNGNGSYAPPTNVFDVLTKNGDSTYTLTLKNQTQYEFATTGKLTRIHEPAGNQITLSYVAGKLVTITDTSKAFKKASRTKWQARFIHPGMGPEAEAQ